MKHHLCGLFVALLAACNTVTPPEEHAAQDSLATAAPVAAPVAMVTDTAEGPRFPADSNTIIGDFNGDGHTESAFVVRTKEGHGNPVEDGVPDEYAIQFSDTLLPPINIGCCEARLFNNSDLNKDDADDILVFQAPMNGNTHWLNTWTFKSHRWKELMEPIVVPTGGDYVEDEDVRKRVFLENDTLYFLDIDPNDEHWKLLKKKAVLR
ncbi:hypothetical protein [Chitinophaga sp.]|uniref:hypothetical protein n=1 Tax=Chitinophaga sp. TaxID=1869181 RepID=UPI002F951016